jgi:hypothetical protein
VLVIAVNLSRVGWFRSRGFFERFPALRIDKAMHRTIDPELAALLDRADRARQDARQLVAASRQWQTTVEATITRMIECEADVRRKVGMSPLPGGVAHRRSRDRLRPLIQRVRGREARCSMIAWRGIT